MTATQIRNCLVCYLVIGCLATTQIGAAADQGKNESPLFEVRAVRNIAYYDGPDADKIKHRLDLYLPKGTTDFPVVMFVHGGAWMFGDKNFFGVHEAVGRMFARHGIGSAVISYRLSPSVQHPEHEKDVARAFAWLHTHVKEYGGRPDELFVCGHSAGGHLVALLGTDESYLKAEGLTLSDIKGVMPISGVYIVPDGLFNSVFGNDKDVHKKASPMFDVHPGCPPFCILYGDDDFPTCGAVSETFSKTLKDAKIEVECHEINGRSHVAIITGAGKDDDPCSKALVNFVMKHVKNGK